MAVAFSARSWVRLSFCISDMREDVLLSNITSEGVHRCFKRTVCPSLCVIARLVELPSCVSRCLSWREKLGASEWSWLLSAVVLSLLPAPLSGVCHFPRPFHPGLRFSFLSVFS